MLRITVLTVLVDAEVAEGPRLPLARPRPPRVLLRRQCLVVVVAADLHPVRAGLTRLALQRPAAALPWL